MKRVVLVWVALLSIVVGGFAQSTHFSTDKDRFIEELKAYLTSATSKDDRVEAEALMKDFQGVWNMHYDATEAALAIDLYELMRSKTANRAYYNIFTFTEVLLRAPYNGMTKGDMNRFLNYTKRRFAQRQAQMDKYLKSCRDLFVDHLMAEKGATQWIAPNANFTFPTDTACLFVVKQCDLMLKSDNDQSVIHDTYGRFNLETRQWVGQGGRVDWSRFGIPTDKVYGILDDYQINLNASSYRIETINFYNMDYFTRPCLCSFEDAVTNATPNEKTMFPKAMSKGDNVEFGKLFGNIEFLGGFGMVGNAVNFFGDGDHPAQFVFRHRNRVTVRVRAKRFIMSDKSLISSQASARVYLYDSVHQTVDSIYHNDLGFWYNNDKNQVLLYRKDNGVGTGPFHDTYHEYDIFLEAIYWDRNTDVMEFRRLEGTSGDSEGVVSSVNYFRKADYLKIQALDMKHPMENLNQFVKLFADEHHRFNIHDYVAYIKYPLSQVLSLILNLQAEGYLEFEKDTQTVTILDRFFDVLASDHNEFDFDVIKFQTRTTDRQPNIRLSLRSNDMQVYGIHEDQVKANMPAVTLSDFKHVLILLDDASIVLKKHRDFFFSGCVMAGMYEFFTKDCFFNYNRFAIVMNDVDSLRFYARFNDKVYPVEGTLERLAGTLEIDENDNKSSVRETPDYPKFHSTGNAYKFYRNINGGVFDPALSSDSISDEVLAGKFYYCLDPFTAERLDNLNSEDIALKGRLVSGGIFPDIVEPLVVMEDHSLGFKHQIGNGDSDSYPMFGGKGGFHQEVFLSDEGFFGQGQLDVESSEFMAPHFDFYLDSVTAAVQSFVMHESNAGTTFPKATCGPMEVKWDLTEPRLYATTLEEPICMYDSTFFRGTTKLSDAGFLGDGVLTFGLTRFNSKYFDFDARSFVADSSDFVLYDEDAVTEAFLADNYRLNVNLGAKQVQFGYLDAKSNLDFPLNKFYCSLNQAEWDMASNSIHLHGEASEFVSLLPEQDSLSFYSTNADYDMNEYVIHAHEVKSVKVADAEIVPWDFNIDIMRNAEISPLEHATIVADTANQAHVFKDAAVSIYSRHDYSALGTKDYLDSEGVATPLFFDAIAPVDGITVGHAEIADTLWFMLNPYFGFKGEVISTANRPFDLYDGYYRLDQSCLEDTVWFVSATEIDPEAVSIDIDMNKVRKVRQGFFNGLCYEYGSKGGYHVNFMKPMNPETVDVTVQNGTLTYDVEHQSYVIQDTLRSDQELRLSERCVVTKHGTSNLGFDEGLTQFTCYGEYVNYPNDSVTIDVLNVFKAPIFDDEVLQEIAEIYAMVDGEAIDLTKTNWLDYLRSEKGEGAVATMQQEIELSGYPEVSDDSFYDNTIVIPSLKMVWNPELRAFVSVGKIGLGNLGKHVVNRYVDGRVVYDKRLGVITYFFENDLFMTYLSYNCGDGQLQVHATYGTINARLSEMDEKSRETRSGNSYFEYVVTPYEAITGFLTKLRRAGAY
ncbi:MAG: hypothetical protein IKU00_02230 [Bacteroidales bacterium]|nr:hypothetical protein [Bacteroidales bacterium]